MCFDVIMRKLWMVANRFSSRSRQSNVSRMYKAVGLSLGFFIMFTTFKMASWTPEGETRQEMPRSKQSIYGDGMHADIHVRQDTCRFCMGAFLQKPKDVITSNVCQADGRDDEAEREDIAPHTLFVIITSEERGRFRKALRQTWLQHTRFNRDVDYRHVFYMGIKNGKRVSSAVKLEHYVHDDLVVGNFTDNSANETIKLMRALSYAAFKCLNAKRVLVTTDHVMFNKTRYLHYLRRHRLQAAVGGQCLYGLKVDPLDETSPWYSTNNENPWGYYPDFCLTNAMVIENSSLRDIVYSSIGVPFFRIPSIYLGFVMHYMKIKAVTVDGFYASVSDYDPCTSPSSAAVIQLSNRDNLTALWTKTCNTLKQEQSLPLKQGTNQLQRKLAPESPTEDDHTTSDIVTSSVLYKLPVKAKRPLKEQTDSQPVKEKVVKKPRSKSFSVKALKHVKGTLSPLPVNASSTRKTRSRLLPTKDLFSIKQKLSPAKTTIALAQQRISGPDERNNIPERTKSLLLNVNDVLEQPLRKAPSKRDIPLLKRVLKPMPVKRKDFL